MDEPIQSSCPTESTQPSSSKRYCYSCWNSSKEARMTPPCAYIPPGVAGWGYRGCLFLHGIGHRAWGLTFSP